MYKIKLTIDASNDINKIVLFFFQSKNKDNLILFELLEEKIHSLEKFKERGSNPRHKKLRNKGYKFNVIKVI